MLCAVFLAACAAAVDLPAARQNPPPTEWLLVRGAEDDYQGIGLDQIGQAYLRGKTWRVVHSAEVPQDYTGGLFLVGTPSGNALLAQKLQDAGILVLPDALLWQGRRVPSGHGLIFKGAGFAVFTGVEASGVHACFTLSANVMAGPARVVRAGQEVAISSLRPADLDIEFAPQLQLRRLDRVQTRWLLGGAEPQAEKNRSSTAPEGARSAITEDGGMLQDGDRALAAARAVEGYASEFRRIYAGGPAPRQDLFQFHLWLLRHQRPEIQRVARVFGEVDLQRELSAIYQRCLQTLGASRQPAPAVTVLIALPGDCNALTSDLEPISGRPRVIINLAAFTDLATLRLVAAHEFIHCFQMSKGATLSAGRLVTEGVATYLSQEIVPGTPDHQALMWSEAKFAAAQGHHAAAAEAYLQAARAGDDSGWFYLATPPPGTAALGLPDRCGYYLGWWAARAWRQAHPQRPLRDMLHLGAADLLAQL